MKRLLLVLQLKEFISLNNNRRCLTAPVLFLSPSLILVREVVVFARRRAITLSTILLTLFARTACPLLLTQMELVFLV